jgi:hypothetical protein
MKDFSSGVVELELWKSELFVAMFLGAPICGSFECPASNPLSIFGNSCSLCILVGGRTCLKTEKLKMPVLAALLSTRNQGFVN